MIIINENNEKWNNENEVENEMIIKWRKMIMMKMA